LVLLRLFASWRLSSPASSRHISILGQTLSYPTGNASAVIVLVLALLGAVVVATAVAGAVKELVAARRFARWLALIATRRVDGVFVIDDDRPQAFCAGLLRPRVYFTSAALARLDEAAVAAVLAHERHHARSRDPLRLAASRVLAQALFFLPSLRRLAQRRMLFAELGADESAIRAKPGNRSALARAMLSFAEPDESGDQVGIDPVRVDHLLGQATGWRFPVLLCVSTAAVIFLVLALAMLAGREAVGSATLAPPFLTAQPCVVVLALIPAAVSAVIIRLRRRARARTGD
jgi:hypothetical protein